MTEKKLKDELQNRLLEASLIELVTIIRSFKNGGGTQRISQRVLEQMRLEQSNDVLEDKILELMDFNNGYCSPHMQIW